MNKEFIINLFFLIFINLLIKPFYVFGIDIGVQNAVGESSYGLYFTLFGYCLLLQIFADLGIQNYNSTYISKNPEKAKEHIPKLLATKVLLSLTFLGMLFLAAWLLDYPAHYYRLIFYIGINQILLSFILYLRTNLSATGYYRWDSIISIIDRLLLIIVLAYLLWFSPTDTQNSFKIEWFIWAQTFAFTCTLFFLLVLIWKKIGLGFLQFSIPFSKKYLKQSLPFALIIILMTAYTRMDSIMLERLLLDEGKEAGIYAASYRLLDASNMIGYLFATLLLPMFASLIGKKESVADLLNLSFKLIFFGALCLVSFMIFNAFDIMSTLYNEGHNPYYAEVLQVVIISFLAIGVSYVFGTLLTSNANTRPMNILFAIGLIFNLILNLILIPEYKAYGAGLATVFTQFLVMFGQIILVIKIFRIPLELLRIARIIIILSIVPAIFWWLSTTTITWWLNFPIGIILCLLVSLLIRFIDVKELNTSLRSMKTE